MRKKLRGKGGRTIEFLTGGAVIVFVFIFYSG